MDITEAVTAYGAAWNETDDAKRRALLEQSFAADGVYMDPAGPTGATRSWRTSVGSRR